MITPVEIQSKAFKSGIGYEKKDVDAFMNEILENYEELYRSNVEMKDKINMLNEGLQHYKNIEASLQKALVLAEKTSEETIRTAELKAQTIEADAVNKAKEHTQDAKQELERVHNQTVALVQQYTMYKAQFTSFLNAQLDLIKSDTFKMDGSEFAAFAKTAASAKDAYMNTNPMEDFVAAAGSQRQLSGYDNGEDAGVLGERDDADRYNMNYTGQQNATGGDFVDPFKDAADTRKKQAEAQAEAEAPKDDTFEGEVEDKVNTSNMLEDEEQKSDGFTFI